MKQSTLLFFLLATACVVCAQVSVPKVYTNVNSSNGKWSVVKDGVTYPEEETIADLTLTQALGNHAVSEQTINFDFLKADLSGSLTYGLIHYKDSKHPMPVFRRTVEVKGGKASINIKDSFGDRYDMVGWQKSGKGTIGYRLTNSFGRILYEGYIGFIGKENFARAINVFEGPFVNTVKDREAVISFETDAAVITSVRVNVTTFSDAKPARHHEIAITGLSPSTLYTYTILGVDNEQTYSFKTAPEKGVRKPFTFAYASDSRSGYGGGERDMMGINYYIMKKIMAAAQQRSVAFMQFTGDLVNGYVTNADDMRLQYANWKRSIEPFAHYFPVYVGMGNHEALTRNFSDGKTRFSIDRFPFETESAEVIFAENFVNPVSDLISEDGASYDPDKKNTDFPTYRENVFAYTHDNVAMIVLNSNYFYAPTGLTATGGGLHAYIMDQQVAWLKKTIDGFEKDKTIDHIFITEHTPFFPNGGHVSDDMWYRGNNTMRSNVAGIPLAKGILERRDEMLDYFMNSSKKVIAILTGDEHNYCLTKIDNTMDIYPPNWMGARIDLSRTIYQVNNGAAGAPYYAQEQTPWTKNTSGFTTQHALVLFHVNGLTIDVQVINPDTLEEISRYTIRK
jgi:Calcineurin-like phosphoesterase